MGFFFRDPLCRIVMVLLVALLALRAYYEMAGIPAEGTLTFALYTFAGFVLAVVGAFMGLFVLAFLCLLLIRQCA